MKDDHATGFPTGGNSVVVLNSELRVHCSARSRRRLPRCRQRLPAASDLDFTDLRPAAGFGVRYRSPRIGPVRVDLGFNLDRRELVPGRPERRCVIHFLLGQAF